MSAPAAKLSEGTTDLTSDGSLLKTILVEGDGEEAGRGAKVAVKYALRLTDDRDEEPFDTSQKRKDGILEFTLGRKKVIPALELLAQSMKLGERCRAKAAAPYAFGSKGLKRKGVPADSPIYLEVEMIRFEGGEKKKTLAEMTPAERFEQAKECKEAGNTFFKELKYEKAMGQYSQCIRYLSNVFYKPNVPSAADSAPGEQKTEERVESGVGAGDKAASKDAEESRNEEEAGEEQVEEEGFEEAHIIDIPPANLDALPTGAGAEEVVETLDVSTAKNDDGGEAEASLAETKADDGLVATDIPNGIKTRDATSAFVDGEKYVEKSEAAEEPENDDPTETEVRGLHVTTLNNLSLCLVKLEDYKRAVESASLALEIDPESSKALYYRGRAQIALGEWDKAREDLVAAARIQPSNVGIRLEIQKLDKKVKLFQDKERKQAAAMFA